jgi:hypothetical protein
VIHLCFIDLHQVCMLSLHSIASGSHVNKVHVREVDLYAKETHHISGETWGGGNDRKCRHSAAKVPRLKSAFEYSV